MDLKGLISNVSRFTTFNVVKPEYAPHIIQHLSLILILVHKRHSIGINYLCNILCVEGPCEKCQRPVKMDIKLAPIFFVGSYNVVLTVSNKYTCVENATILSGKE